VDPCGRLIYNLRCGCEFGGDGGERDRDEFAAESCAGGIAFEDAVVGVLDTDLAILSLVMLMS